MATSTINVSLPGPPKFYVEARVESGAFGTPSEYIRELIQPVELSDEEWAHGDIFPIAEERLGQRG